MSDREWRGRSVDGRAIHAPGRLVRSLGTGEVLPEDAAQVEWEADLLVQLVGRRGLERLDIDDPANARFFEWMAREARLSLSTAERAKLGAGAAAFARRMRRKIAAERHRCEVAVRAIRGVPEEIPSGVGESHTAPTGRPRAAPWFDMSVAAGVGRDLWEEPCERWISIPEGVADGRFVALTVAGDSMLPLLHTGDVILVRLGAELAVNSIVVARHPDDGYVVKRVGRLAGGRVELTSLNPAYEAVTIPRDDALVLGTVVLRWCTHGGRGKAQ